MNLALNNLQWLICRKTKPNHPECIVLSLSVLYLLTTYSAFVYFLHFFK